MTGGSSWYPAKATDRRPAAAYCPAVSLLSSWVSLSCQLQQLYYTPGWATTATSWDTGQIWGYHNRFLHQETNYISDQLVWSGSDRQKKGERKRERRGEVESNLSNFSLLTISLARPQLLELRWGEGSGGLVWEGMRGRSQPVKLYYSLRTAATIWLKTRRQDNRRSGVEFPLLPLLHSVSSN